MHIGQILDHVYDQDVGWRPSSGGIKPVHVANGMVRTLQHAYHDTARLHEFVVWWRAGKKPDEQRSFDALVTGEATGTYSAFAGNPRKFERVRKYVLGLLGADGALFPSADHSSFSLSHGSMVTRDTNDRGLGVFAAVLLGGMEVEALGELARLVMESTGSSHPRDPATALAWPLLAREATPAAPAIRSRRLLGARHHRAFFERTRLAADTLAGHERIQGDHMRTLQRAVHFACVGTIAHALALSANGDLAVRPPLLLVASGSKQADLARASERSLDLFMSRFESWLGDRLAVLIEQGHPLADDDPGAPADTLDGRAIRGYLARIAMAEKGHALPDSSCIDDRMQDFKQARTAMGDSAPARVLAHALVAAYLREYESGGPRRFLQGLGRRCGLFYPHFQGRAREKRIRPSVPVLDMLVRACVPANSAVPLDDFLQRIWERFGIVVGGRRNEVWDDAAVLAANRIAVDSSSLTMNCEALVDELAAMGHARRLSDNVTFIGDAFDAG